MTTRDKTLGRNLTGKVGQIPHVDTDETCFICL